MTRIAKGNPDLFLDWTDEEAWLAGLIWSDGCLHIEANHKRVIFTSTDLGMADLAGAIAGVPTRVYAGGSHDEHHRKTYGLVNIGRQEVVERLIAVGLEPRKSIVGGFPSGLPGTSLGAFIRGYFDGNGCVGLYRNKSKTQCRIPRLKSKFTGARSVLEGIQEVARSQARISPKKLTPAGSVWQLNYNHRDSLLLHEFMYSQGGPCLARKKRLFLQGAAQPFPSR